MLNGYIGTVTRKGLCEILVEEHQAMLRIQRAASGRPSTCIGFWATLPDDAARFISGLIDQGERKAALRLLNQAAREGGHLLPINQ